VSDQRPDPGWYPDPSGRFEQRYWSGDDWTEWVMLAGSQQIDRFWDGPRIGGDTVGQPAGVGAGSAPSTPSSPGSGGDVPRLTRREALRERLARPRPPASVQSAVAAAAGIAVVLGILVLAGDAPDRTALVLLGVVVTTVAYGLALVGPEQSRSAGLAGAVVGPAMIVVSALGDTFSGTAQVVVPLLILAAVWAAMFVAPGFTGAPILLAGCLLAGWSALVSAIWGSRSRDADWLFYEPVDSLGDPVGGFESTVYVDTGPFPVDFQNLTSTTAMVTVLAALACVVAAGVADRKGWEVLGTPLIATGVVLSAAGLWVAAIAFVGDAELVAFLTIAVGVALLVVGALGDRRGSVWIGAATGLTGLIALLVQIVDSQTGGGIALLVVGAVLFAAAPGLERSLRRSAPQVV
jgi:hypothetical protein